MDFLMIEINDKRSDFFKTSGLVLTSKVVSRKIVWESFELTAVMDALR